MDLVIDTNRIMAGLLRDSISRRIMLHDTFSFSLRIISKPNLQNTGRAGEKGEKSRNDFDFLMHALPAK